MKSTKKKYLLVGIGIIFLLVVLVLAMTRKQKVSPLQLLPFLDTPGKNPLVKRIKTLTTRGGRVDWSPDGSLIAFDRLGEDGYYDVWVMRPNGEEQECLTCSKNYLPQGHNGNPAWYPSQEFIVFQSQDPKLIVLEALLFGKARIITGPGIGINNNLWLMSKGGNQFWQLTHISNKMGLLHPHFSHDGKKLVWSERVSNQPKPQGQWVIKIADFVFGDHQPRLENIKGYRPQNMQFYETHGFFADNKRVLLSATPDGIYTHLEIYAYNPETGELEQLTSPDREWDEHAQFSPDGTKIVWVSSTGYAFDPEKPQNASLDLWLMETSSENKIRLTYFNDPTAPEYLGKQVAAADSSFSPDGKSLIVYVIVDGVKQEGVNFRIEFE